MNKYPWCWMLWPYITIVLSRVWHDISNTLQARCLKWKFQTYFKICDTFHSNFNRWVIKCTHLQPITGSCTCKHQTLDNKFIILHHASLTAYILVPSTYIMCHSTLPQYFLIKHLCMFRRNIAKTVMDLLNH